METITTQQEARLANLAGALEAYQDAAHELAKTWQPEDGDAIAGYPDYLPSFDEHACDVAGMRVTGRRVDQITVGSRWALARDADWLLWCLKPENIPPAGATGTIVDLDDEHVSFRLDLYFEGLEEWHNEIVFSSSDTFNSTARATDPRIAARDALTPIT